MSVFASILTAAHYAPASHIPTAAAAAWLDALLGLLFAERAAAPLDDITTVQTALAALAARTADLTALLALLPDLPRPPAALAAAFEAALPGLRTALLADAAFLAATDPAATSAAEVISTYPGFLATAVYRVAHALHTLGAPRLPRLLTELAHARTGIDLHPGAHIGVPFAIDHGTGLVVGATAVVGCGVVLYQGVTLGAIHVEKALAHQKRHPTIEDHVVVYAGATILGGATVVGAHSIVGGNVWLTRSVPAHSRVYYRTQVEVRAAGPAEGLIFEI